MDDLQIIKTGLIVSRVQGGIRALVVVRGSFYSFWSVDLEGEKNYMAKCANDHAVKNNNFYIGSIVVVICRVAVT